jgi:hypothetical protein
MRVSHIGTHGLRPIFPAHLHSQLNQTSPNVFFPESAELSKISQPLSIVSPKQGFHSPFINVKITTINTILIMIFLMILHPPSLFDFSNRNRRIF